VTVLLYIIIGVVGLILIAVIVLLVTGKLSEASLELSPKGLKFSGKAAPAPVARGWREITSTDVPKGDTRNSEVQWIRVQTTKTWRVRYGTRTRRAENGHLTIRVYRRDPKTDKGTQVVAQVVRLVGSGIFRRDNNGRVLQETGDFFVQVDPETEWWWVRVDEQE